MSFMGLLEPAATLRQLNDTQRPSLTYFLEHSENLLLAHPQVGK